jgi:hypothetical protein
MSNEATKILVLAAVGVGAFVLVQRMRAAPAGAALPATNSPAAAALYQKNDGALWKQIGGILGNLVPRDVAARQAAAVAVSGPGAAGGYIGDEAFYVPDAAAVNPVASLVQGGFAYAMDGSNGAFWN